MRVAPPAAPQSSLLRRRPPPPLHSQDACNWCMSDTAWLAGWLWSGAGVPPAGRAARACWSCPKPFCKAKGGALVALVSAGLCGSQSNAILAAAHRHHVVQVGACWSARGRVCIQAVQALHGWRIALLQWWRRGSACGQRPIAGSWARTHCMAMAQWCMPCLDGAGTCSHLLQLRAFVILQTLGTTQLVSGTLAAAASNALPAGLRN